MSARRSRVTWVVAAILAVQLAVPAYSTLTSEEQSPRFGWNMFRSVVRLPALTVVTPDGRQRIGGEEYRSFVPEPRAEIDYAERLAPVVCRARPDAESVEVGRGTARTVHPCR